MSAAEIDAVVREIAALAGQRLDGVWQPARDRVILGIGGERILLVPRGDAARLHRIATRPPNPARPFSFQGALRTRLGAVLEGVARVPGERAVDLDFTGFRLHLRLTGRSGGLWLLVDGAPVAAHDGPATALPAFAAHVSRPEAPRFQPGTGPWAANTAADTWFTAKEAAEGIQRRRAAALAAARREVSRIQRRIANLDDDLARARLAPALRAEADLLAMALHRVRKGATGVSVEDPDSPGRIVAIALDPARTPAANREAMYGRARRLEKAAELADVRRTTACRQLVALRDAIAGADRDDADIPRLEALLPRVRPTPGDPAAVPWTRWVGPAGQEVLVGKSAAGNRRLTFQRARGRDWWMHLRDAPGAHLVIPTPPERTPSLEVLLGAAQIALHTARVPAGTSAEVMYARIRDVRAIPGDSAGRVTVRGERVLRVTADPLALAAWSSEP
jgi:predicted ribosome quality control (RQC) complex YloA/Tae2 family protein